MRGIMSISKLELKWYGKENEISVEPRILVEDSSLSNNDKIDGYTNNQTLDNILVHGDNLLALKALEQDFINKIQCVYIDPPYNTRSAFEHYDDNVEHSTWLSLMSPRLLLLRKLLADTGVIFIHIDNNEYAYLKVLCDEIFGRKNYMDTLIPVMNPRGNQANKYIATMHEYILVYAKNIDNVKFNKLELSDQQKKEYNQYDNVKGLYYREMGLRKRGAGSRRIDAPNQWYPIFYNPITEHISTNENEINQDYVKILPMLSNGEEGRWRWSFKSVEENSEQLIVRKVRRGQSFEYDVFQKDYLTEDKRTKIKSIIDEATNNEIATRHLKELGIPFDNPKPEGLIKQILEIGSSEGDIVLDSFLGSGTTAAVAHKMRRRWIGIEMGNQAYTHCKVRLDKVISNQDSGEISTEVNWIGGGGYKFYELAPTLVKVDSFGQPIINPEYNAEMLAIAVSKHEGYIFEPHDSIYWKQSKNGEKSFLFVTTKHISNESLEHILNSINDDEYLLIVCKSYDKGLNNFAKNINIKKIPQSLLKNCEYGVENYNLNIIDVSNFEYEDDSND
jgi:adenine-specific DNA-methyltransferase